jgi:hypothetical protein
MKTHSYRKFPFSLALAAFFLFGCSGSDGDTSSAQFVETPGAGRYEKIKSNVGVVVSDGSIQATIPKTVSVGQTIDVTFENDGQRTTDRWRVVRISTRGNLCRLHSAPAREVGNTVFVRPCKVAR